MQRFKLEQSNADIVSHVGFALVGQAGQVGTGSELNAKATEATGRNETRPVNINMMYCIKYAD
jgi:hypothetical protein